MKTLQDKESDKDSRTKIRYDIKILKWLLGYIKPYGFPMTMSLILMVTVAILEVLVPHLTKKAVDEYIYPPWRKTVTEPTEKQKKLLDTLGKEKTINIIRLEDKSYLIDISSIEKFERETLVKSKIFDNKKYLVISPEQLKNSKELKEIIEKHPHTIKKAENHFYIDFESLKKLESDATSIIRQNDLSRLKRLVLYLFLSILGIFTFTSLYNYTLYYCGHKIMHTLRTEAFSHILKLPQPYFDKNPVGRITTRVTNDINAINEVFTSVIIQFLKDVIVITGVIVIMYSMDPTLTYIMIGLTVFLAIIAAAFRVKLKTAFRNIRSSIGKLNAFVQETLKGMLLIKLYGREVQNYKRFVDINRENLNANMSQLWTYATFRPFIEYVSITATAIIIWYGGSKVSNLQLTIGTLIAYLYYSRMLFKPILELAEKYNLFQHAVAASENLYEIMNEKEEESGPLFLDSNRITVEFKNVWFAYKKDEWVLKDVSFSIKPGKTVALVGLTGSGKTTVVNLLLKFYKAQRGKILINGINIEKINNKSLRSNITAIFQDIFLFGKDITDTPLYTSELWKEIGIKRIFNNHNRLSSGENQIMALAKALSKKSALLIMDEATSHIDAVIEQSIQKKIKEKDPSQSKLIIAHRLSNVVEADNIIVLHKGKIAEEGKHHNLLKKKEIYYTLYNLQKEVEKANTAPTY